jgi:hypothetical protein
MHLLNTPLKIIIGILVVCVVGIMLLKIFPQEKIMNDEIKIKAQFKKYIWAAGSIISVKCE